METVIFALFFFFLKMLNLDIYYFHRNDCDFYFLFYSLSSMWMGKHFNEIVFNKSIFFARRFRSSTYSVTIIDFTPRLPIPHHCKSELIQKLT